MRIFKSSFLPWLIVIVAALGLSLSVPARADITIDFSTGNGTFQGGTVSYAGTGIAGDAPLVGTNIVIGDVLAADTPANAGTHHSVVGTLGGFGDLDFTTGNFLSYNPAAFGGPTYFFGSGGSLTITGWVPDAGMGAFNHILVNASPISGSFTTNTRELTVLLGSDTKDATLLRYFGLAPNTPFQIALGTVHTEDLHAFGGGTFVGGGSFTSKDALSTDIPNAAAVPEPATMFLLGSGLIGLAGFARRKFRK